MTRAKSEKTRHARARRPKLFARALLGVALALGMSSAPSARAQTNVELSQQRFEQAKAAYDTGDYARARELFEAALALYGSPNARLYMARSLRALKRLPEAVNAYERTAREADAFARTEPRYAAAAEAARSELAAIEPLVARVRIRLVAAPAGTRASVGDVQVPEAAWGLSLAVTPGPSAVVVTPPRGAPITRNVTLPAGRETTVEIAVPPPAEPSVATSHTTARPALRVGPITWIGGAVAVAGAAGFTVFRLLAAGRYQYLEDHSCSVATSTGCADARSQGPVYERVAYASAGVGVVGLAVAVVGLFVGGATPERARVSFAPGGAAFGGAF